LKVENHYFMWLLVIIGIVLFLALIGWIVDITDKVGAYNRLKPRLDDLDSYKQKLDGKENKLLSDKRKWEEVVAQQKNEIEQLTKEKSEGFPWLAKAFADYFYLKNLSTARY
jgi:biopolymer transport protein ExbB/TolQ